MTPRVTLITPPDIYQNNNISLMFIDITDDEQNASSKWLGQLNSEIAINIYFFQGETNAPWIFHSLAASKYKYLNLNNASVVTQHLAGYILSKQDVYYTTDNDHVAALYSHINCNRVTGITDFLERVLSGKE